MQVQSRGASGADGPPRRHSTLESGSVDERVTDSEDRMPFHAARMRRPARHGGLLVAGSLLLGGCATPTLVLDGGLHLPRLDGTIALSNTSLTSIDEVDLATDLNLDSADGAPWLHGEFDSGRFALSGFCFRTETSGSGTVSADFGGITAGSAVTSDLDLTLAQGRALFDVIDFEGLELGAGLALQWIDVALDVDEQTFGLSESVEVRQPVPLLAARAGCDLEPSLGVPLQFEVAAAWIRARVGDLGGGVLDAEAMLHVRHGMLGAFAGWRTLRVDLDGASAGQEFSVDVELAGFLFGASLRF
jgi:hypothetical protein